MTAVAAKWTFDNEVATDREGSVFVVRCLLGWFAALYKYVAVR
jgi:hypothetical protein